MPETTTRTTLRLELFVADVAQSVRFYTDVLGFVLEHGPAVADYNALVRGDVRLSVQTAAALSADHPLARPGPKGLGVEFVLEVDELDAVYAHVAARHPVIAAPAMRPWGLRDFRVLDPDGYYWRITTR